jgi:hypothetical protein
MWRALSYNYPASCTLGLAQSLGVRNCFGHPDVGLSCLRHSACASMLYITCPPTCPITH